MSNSGLFIKNPYAGQYSSHKKSGYKTIAEKRKRLEKKTVKDKSKYSSNTIHKYNKSYGQSKGNKNSSQTSCKNKYSNYSVYLTKDRSIENSDYAEFKRLHTEQDHLKHKKLSLNFVPGELRLS